MSVNNYACKITCFGNLFSVREAVFEEGQKAGISLSDHLCDWTPISDEKSVPATNPSG